MRNLLASKQQVAVSLIDFTTCLMAPVHWDPRLVHGVLLPFAFNFPATTKRNKWVWKMEGR